jgi:hypothetical protein
MQRVTEDQYLTELNRALREDEDYQEGMEFLPSPPGSHGREMRGYTFAGRFEKPGWTGVYARVAHKVAERFRI